MSLRVQVDDTVESINTYFYERGMTDGLPVVPPNEERVAAAIAASGRRGDESLGVLPTLNGPVTIEKIAINSVMAGCETAYMPAMIAIMEAVLDEAFDARDIQATTNPASPMIIFNGPIRKKLGINCGAGCFGPGTKANATIGRALRLILLNVGGAVPGEVDKAPLGWPGKYNSCCVGENEEESPWEPLHVERGFQPSDSAVTLLSPGGMWPIVEISPDPAIVVQHLTYGMIHREFPGLARWEQVLVMSPVIAKMVGSLIPTKQALKKHLFENARIPLAWYPPYVHDDIREHLKEFGYETKDGLIPVTFKPENYIILCAGGNAGFQSCGLSSKSYAVTKKIVDVP